MDRGIITFKKSYCNSGFAILDVLVATLIFAISIGVIFHSISASLALIYKSNKVLFESCNRETIAAAYIIGDSDWINGKGMEIEEKEEEYKNFVVEYVIVNSQKEKIILLKKVYYVEESAEKKE